MSADWSGQLGEARMRRAWTVIHAGEGAPGLTQWERDFLAGTAEALRRRGVRLTLSPPQADILAEIEAKMLSLGLITQDTTPADQPALL